MNYIISDLKRLHFCLMDQEDTLLDKPQGVVAKAELEEKELAFLKSLIHLVMTTKIVSKKTKAYLKSGEISVNRFVLAHNNCLSDGNRLKASTVSQAVDYDRKKLQAMFPDKVITWILSGKNEDLVEYEKILSKCYSKYASGKNMLKNIVLEFKLDGICEAIEDNSFKEFIEIIAPYTKSHIKYIVENIDKKQLDYINYIISSPNLNKKSLEHLNELKLLLGVETEITNNDVLDFDFHSDNTSLDVQSDNSTLDVQSDNLIPKSTYIQWS